MLPGDNRIRPTRIDCKAQVVAEMLDKTQWANDFSFNEILSLGEYIHAFWARKGTIIFSEGDVDQSMGVIVKGTVQIYKSDTSNRSSVIATLKSPQTFGEMALIDGEPRSATAMAADTVEMLIITKDQFEALSKARPPLAFKLLWKISRQISQRLRRTSWQLVEYLEEEV